MHAGNDVIHVLRVGHGLFGARLQQARGESGGFLRILQFGGLLRLLGDFVQGGLDDLQVQFDQLFETGEHGRLGSHKGVEVGFLAVQNLLRNGAHRMLLDG
ncbi:hypothetical protein D9M70_560900 [compost metagenome]